ncbi:MAG: tRNA preQ1(34) S-adenosylmethionine ribosyltransferase-isomerase QueA [Verrucomicrobiota bacterium]
MLTDAFSFHLPDHLIAQRPTQKRDEARLLILHRSSGAIVHSLSFRSVLDYLRAGDVLVLNNSRVIPARLRARKAESGGQIEVLLLREVTKNLWWAMVRPGKRLRPGSILRFDLPTPNPGVTATIREKNKDGHCSLAFAGTEDIAQELDAIGEIPLPPYLTRPADETDRERYQTVYARTPGSVAAPTAGLHFTSELLEQVRQLGVEIHYVTLHIGPGTFAPVKAANLEGHLMHEEHYEVPLETAVGVNSARASGRRVIAVGTTSVRVLESVAAASGGQLRATVGSTRIFIYPPYPFRMIDGLVTNFHLPRSTLLMLVSAFAAPGQTTGREMILQAYAEAMDRDYRFFSYGDAMLIL